MKKITTHYSFGLMLGCAITCASWLAFAGEPSATGPVASGVADIVLQHGITGAMLLIVLYGYYKKDKQYGDESAARVADSKAFGEAMRVQVVATTTQMERFNDTAEALVQELREERRAERPSTLQRPPTLGGTRR